MTRTCECPCCRGFGLKDCHPRHEEEKILDCEECEGTGQVTWTRHQELLAWQRRVCSRTNDPPPKGRRRA
jgi:DnaJ-class molecular chaperone